MVRNIYIYISRNLIFFDVKPKGCISVFRLMRIFIISDLIDPQYCLLIEDKRKEKFVQVLILWIVKLRIIAKFKIYFKINLIKILNLFFPKFAVKSKGIYIYRCLIKILIY